MLEAYSGLRDELKFVDIGKPYYYGAMQENYSK
jgi:hypothetical protein